MMQAFQGVSCFEFFISAKMSHLTFANVFRVMMNTVLIQKKKKKRRGVVIATVQLHSTKPELKFCAGSKPGPACQRFTMARISDNGPGWK